MNYFTELYKAFRRSHGPTITTVGFLMSIGFFYITPDQAVEFKYLVPIAIILAIIIFTLVDLSLALTRSGMNLIPKIRQARECPKLYSNGIAMLLLDPSPIFGVESFVSVYSRETDFEILIGYGFVANVQENGLIQVIVLGSLLNETDETWNKIVQNNTNDIKKILVKPSLPRTLEGNLS